MNLFYRPLAQQNTPLKVNYSQIARDLTTLFGQFPMVINQNRRDELIVLRRLWEGKYPEESARNPYQVLIKLLADYPDGYRITLEEN